MKKLRTTRQINGVLLLDKPNGVTSNAALQNVKYLFAAHKAGHTGSLDPLASGMLPICFGEATKFSQFLLEADKCYQVIAQLGIRTTTGDAEGKIIDQQTVTNFSEQRLIKILEKFHGEIQQIPSMFSALKYHGKPLYELARQGITIERPARTVFIRELKLLSSAVDRFALQVSCSKGTYIRTLVEDIGDALGFGAHVIELRRLTAGFYQENQMISLPMLETLVQKGDPRLLDDCLLPVDSIVQHWPSVSISETVAYYLLRGQPVVVPHAPPSGWVRLLLNQNQFLGVGEILSDGRVAPRRLLEGSAARQDST